MMEVEIAMLLPWCVAGLVGLVSILTLLSLRPHISKQAKENRKTIKVKHKIDKYGAIPCSTPTRFKGKVILKTSTALHSPCSGCHEVNAKKDCRYNCCAICCRAKRDSVCRVHGTNYQTCLLAIQTATSLADVEFDISYSSLKSCPPGLSGIGAQLVSLNLSNNRLQSLPDSLGDLTGLEELFIQYNCLSALPKSVCKLKALVELDAKNNLLSHLPEDIGCVRSLLSLNLTNNKLTSLPVSIGALSWLEELYVHGNELRRFPEQLCLLRYLKTLYAGENPLNALPVKFGLLSSLKELDLSNCCLTHLPQSLSKCHHLVRVWLSGNRLVELPHGLGNLQQLKELHLRNNKIRYFPSSIELLNLYTFTAQQNCLVLESEARTLSNVPHESVPPLMELCLRAALCLSVEEGELPNHLYEQLSRPVPCSVCTTPTFSHRRTKIVFKTMAVFYRLPLCYNYCSNCGYIVKLGN